MLKDRIERGRWLALVALSFGLLMTALDTTIVTVALPSIASDLHVANISLSWMLNAYTLTFGGFLILSGRLSDLYGPRRTFLTGIVIFTLASLACGFAHTQVGLIVARAIQGLGGAAVTAVGLSLIANLFPNLTERARAMGVYGFVCGGGSAVGQALGGLLTGLTNWHSIFLVNLPIGIAVCALCIVLLPRDAARPHTSGRLDVAGALTATLASTLWVYALVNGGKAGWTSLQTEGLLSASVILLLLFLIIETRVPEPLVPVRLLRGRNFVTVNIVGVLWTAGMLAWLVIATLHLQHVRGYDALHAGLAFVPATTTAAVFSALLSAKILTRFGIRGPLCAGLLLSAAGLALFARAPQIGTFIADVLPAMLLIGLGGGIASTPLLLAAMNDVDTKDFGLASGVLHTSFLMGGALGLAVLMSLADFRTSSLQRAGIQTVAALNGGYHFAMLTGAFFNVAAAALSALMLRSTSQPSRYSPQISNGLQSQGVSRELARATK